MRIAIGSDHRGVELKAGLVARLAGAGHEVLDLGCDGSAACDYPDPAVAVGEAVAAGACELGILLCGSGIGVSIAANKVRGVRAARCRDLADAVVSRRHNDANVICLGADGASLQQVWDLVQAWLVEPFEGGRHAPRVAKIRRYEAARERSGARPAPPAPKGAEGDGTDDR